MSQPSCKQLWREHKNSRVSDLRQLWKAYQEGENSAYYKKISNDIGDFNEYGLCFDYVAPGTFTDQHEGYWRYQISWGGPSEEFRFYASGPDVDCYRITFAFLNWGDGYERKLIESDEELMSEIWNFFQETGLTQAEYDKARED